MPQHSLFNWIVYLLWVGGFLLTFAYVLQALGEAIGDRARLITEGRNGSTMIEARRAIRLEAIRLAVAGILTALGAWAVLTPDAGPPSLRGRVTLIIFLLLGALICSQTWFDRADRLRQLRQP